MRDVPSDCTVVGIPGRIVYRSGVRVNPLEHGSLPDSEATVIRSLVDRIEALEQKLAQLSEKQSSTPMQNWHDLDAEQVSVTTAGSCQLRDKAIQQFLDGAGI